MALYSVSLNRTLILSATVAVRAKNEEAAQARVEQMIAKGAFGTIEWQVSDPNILDWQEEEDEIEIDMVQED
jgi:hypothetical protein